MRTPYRLISAAALVLASASSHAQLAYECEFPPAQRILSFDDNVACLNAGAGAGPGGNGGDANIVSSLLPGGTMIDRDPNPSVGPDPFAANDFRLGITGEGGASGTWSVAASTWSLYEDLYLFFHFGNGQNNNANNPDWFFVRLVDGDTGGRWQFDGPNQVNGLSNVALLGRGTPTFQVPEPGSLALAGLALIGLVLTLRRRGRRSV